MFAVFIFGPAAMTQTTDLSPSPAACEWPRGTRVLLDPRELPEPIRASLRQHLPDLAARDAAFQRHDVVPDPPLPLRRFAWAVSGRRSWVVVYEHGGFGDHVHAITFRERGAPHPRGQYMLFPNANLIGSPCAIVLRRLPASMAGKTIERFAK